MFWKSKPSLSSRNSGTPYWFLNQTRSPQEFAAWKTYTSGEMFSDRFKEGFTSLVQLEQELTKVKTIIELENVIQQFMEESIKLDQSTLSVIELRDRSFMLTTLPHSPSSFRTVMDWPDKFLRITFQEAAIAEQLFEEYRNSWLSALQPEKLSVQLVEKLKKNVSKMLAKDSELTTEQVIDQLNTRLLKNSELTSEKYLLEVLNIPLSIWSNGLEEALVYRVKLEQVYKKIFPQIQEAVVELWQQAKIKRLLITETTLNEVQKLIPTFIQEDLPAIQRQYKQLVNSLPFFNPSLDVLGYEYEYKRMLEMITSSANKVDQNISKDILIDRLKKVERIILPATF